MARKKSRAPRSSERPRLVVITGVSRGLGLAMADRLRELGHTVWGCARTKSAVEALKRRFKAPHAVDVVDVSDDHRVRCWAEERLATGDVPDLLLNNAAIVNRNASLVTVPAKDFDRVVAINVCGVANVIRHFVPAMAARGRGVVVNFSSGWGRSTSPDVAPYCATKWAIEGLTRALAEELPDGLAAVALNPGIIDTDMLRSCFGAQAASYPQPDAWSRRAVPYLLALGPRDNGRSLTVGD